MGMNLSLVCTIFAYLELFKELEKLEILRKKLYRTDLKI